MIVSPTPVQNCTMSYRAPELFDVPSNCVLDERSDVRTTKVICICPCCSELFRISFGCMCACMTGFFLYCCTILCASFYLPVHVSLSRSQNSRAGVSLRLFCTLPTPDHLAPAQVWSLGCLLYAIAFHRSPFDLPDTNLGGSIALSVISGKYEIPASSRFSKGFLALIAAMLQVCILRHMLSMVYVNYHLTATLVECELSAYCARQSVSNYLPTKYF